MHDAVLNLIRWFETSMPHFFPGGDLDTSHTESQGQQFKGVWMEGVGWGCNTLLSFFNTLYQFTWFIVYNYTVKT